MVRKIRTQTNYRNQRPRIRMIELKTTLCTELGRRDLTTYSKNNFTVYGKPDLVFAARKVAIFCDNEFSREYSRGSSKGKNNDYRMLGTSIIKNIEPDRILKRMGWTVLRFQENQIKTNVVECVDEIERHLRLFPQRPYRTIDLCAGIGGIRRGFELAGEFVNVLSAEIDKYACMTYKHLFGEDPSNDLTSKAFKERIERTPYDILLAGFPCQTFSRVGLGEGFENEEKGQIFFHIADIINRTRPCAFFLENVDHLVTRDKGETFRRIIDTLEMELKYKVIGVSLSNDGVLN